MVVVGGAIMESPDYGGDELASGSAIGEWAGAPAATAASAIVGTAAPDDRPMDGPLAIVAMFVVIAGCLAVMIATRLSHTEDGQARVLLLNDDESSDETRV